MFGGEGEEVRLDCWNENGIVEGDDVAAFVVSQEYFSIYLLFEIC